MISYRASIALAFLQTKLKSFSHATDALFSHYWQYTTGWASSDGCESQPYHYCQMDLLHTNRMTGRVGSVPHSSQDAS
jgi:hypothetical protein